MLCVRVRVYIWASVSEVVAARFSDFMYCCDGRGGGGDVMSTTSVVE